MSKKLSPLESKGTIAWMVSHPVTANLIMLVLLIGGAIGMSNIKQEIFPEFDLDVVSITVAYPGATPEEVEKGIVVVIEEKIKDIEGIDEIRSQASENTAAISVDLSIGANDIKVYQDIKNTIDRITSLPEEAEKPVVSLAENKHSVLSLIISGDYSMQVLKEIAERLRDLILLEDEVTNIDLAGVRDPEIAVEVPSEELRRYNLTVSNIANLIKANSLEMGGGSIKSKGGEILLKVDQKREYGSEYYSVPILNTAEGVEVSLGEIATITDGFEESDKDDYFNGEHAVRLKVYRVGEQTPKSVSKAVRKVLDRVQPTLPEGITLTIWQDRSIDLGERIDLLSKNIWMGLVLVMILLGCFLQVRLAFWVMMGIPISFLGSFVFLPSMGVSINMISLFAFITSLGMVVDDAIVVGENVFEMRERGIGFIESSIIGAKQVAVPVVFSILTNIVAFAPLLFVPGIMGKIFKVIPMVVISVFVISLFEALYILPAHLAHQKVSVEGDIWSKLNRIENWFGQRLKFFVKKYYKPFLRGAIKQRYLTLVVFLAILITFGAYVAGGHLALIFFPSVASDVAQATIDLPYGTSPLETKKVHDRLVQAAQKLGAEYKQRTGKDLILGIYSGIGSAGRRRGGATALSGGHTTNVEVLLVTTDARDISTTEFKNLWREEIGEIANAERMVFLDDPGGPSGGDPISIALAHSDTVVLQEAADKLAAKLAEYDGVSDIDTGFSQGKAELDFSITPAAKALGFTPDYIAGQIRAHFYGAEALRQQRGRDEVKVMVRLPQTQRRSEYNLEELILRSATGAEMPLLEAVEIKHEVAASSINRIDGRRQVRVAADIADRSKAGMIVTDILQGGFMEELCNEYPGLQTSIAGERQDMQESMSALGYGAIIALFVVYAVLAIPFNSYLQPVIIMVSIPFGVVGAALGHIIMGYDSLSLPSFMGIVALSGVVVNDSLVMVDFANNMIKQKLSPGLAVFRAGIRRFRPIMLTSLTTFGGLAPMIFEKSRQAKFMIPMALSLGYGILFATFIALILVPALYVIVDDIKKLNKKFWAWKIF